LESWAYLAPLWITGLFVIKNKMHMRKLLALLMAVVFCIGQLSAQTQTRSVSGKVTDASGSPLPNVSVMVKGTSTGTTTKSDGTFSLSVSTSAKTLVFSSVGMSVQEVSIG